MKVTWVNDSPIVKIGRGDYEVTVRGTRYLLSSGAQQGSRIGWGVRPVGVFTCWDSIHPTMRAAAASLA